MTGAADDPLMMIRAMAEVTVSLLAMHMTPDALEKAAWSSRAVADRQEALEASGVAIHGANHEHAPALARAVAAFYDSARAQSLALVARTNAPGHSHGAVDGVSRPPEEH